MMKKILVLSVFVVVCMIATGIVGWKSYTSKQSPALLKEDIEAISACESVGWYNNDGNCVNNGRGTYFCKRDTWYELTDCKI